MTKVIGVRFKTSGRIYYFDPGEYNVQPGDGVIVETARGQEFADVLQGITEVEDTAIIAPLKPVLRMATDEDRNMRTVNSGKEDEAFSICAKKIAQHGLDMKLVDVEYSFNGSKVVFYFTADERVDFRELVKDLASQFKTRIELRQIGVRDEAKMLGGLGSCGRPVCCKSFLDDFRPVSIKMAKEQNLSLSPTKISGLCGRLMCCLQYEQAAYEEMKKKMPRVGKDVVTPDGTGIAIENNAITEKTRVKMMLPDGTIEIREYHYTLLAKPGEAPIAVPKPEQEEPVADPAAFVPAQTAPASQAGETAQQGNGQRRHRRGGRGRTGQKPGEQSNSGQSGAGQPRQQSNGGQPGQRPQQPSQRPQRQADGQQPARSPEEGGNQPQRDGEQRPGGNRRRRHRGGGNRPKPENGGTPTV